MNCQEQRRNIPAASEQVERAAFPSPVWERGRGEGRPVQDRALCFDLLTTSCAFAEKAGWRRMELCLHTLTTACASYRRGHTLTPSRSRERPSPARERGEVASPVLS